MTDTGKEAIDIHAPAERIMSVITDIESYPEWMSAFGRAEILETDEQGRPAKAAFELTTPLKTFDYVLEYEYRDGGVAWQSVQGNVKEISGSYMLEESGETTTVLYEYGIDVGIPVPGFLRRQGTKMMVDAALNDLKKRAEQ